MSIYLSGQRNTDDRSLRIVWTIDCESTQKAVDDADLGERSIRGYCELIAAAGLRATLLVLPSEAKRHARLLRECAAGSFEIGLHFHPQEEGYDDFCGAYSAEDQRRMFGAATQQVADLLGFMPTSFRTGSFSANDATFPVTESLGFRCCSHSCPGRNMVSLRSNWVSAPQHVHAAHRHNRLLQGDLDLIEVPVTTDPDSMMWSGMHPQDLRVELFDAKNHRYMIEKVLVREKQRKGAVNAIVTLTHNIFEYSDKKDFRHQTMKQMIADFSELADKHEIHLVPATLSQVAEAYRASHASTAHREVHTQ